MKFLFYIITLLFCFTTANAQVDLNNGLIARFKFNGDATDATSNNYDGTLHGGTITHVLNLGDNTTDFLELPPAIMNGLGDFSVGFTIRFNSLHSTGSFPTNHYLTGSGVLLDRIGFSYENNLNSWRAAINGQTNSFFDPSITPGTIYCVCITRSGNISKVYINENLLGSLAGNGAPIAISSLLVGQEEDCSGGCFSQVQCMNGSMDNLCFWNRALNADEVNELCHLIPNEVRLKEESTELISITPNPAIDYFEISQSNVVRVEVYDINGRLLHTELNSNRVNIQSIPSGIYLVKIYQPDGRPTILKFIKGN